MEIKDLLKLYDQDQRIELRWPNQRREVTEHIIRHVSEGRPHSFVSYAWIDESNADTVIRQEIDYFTALGHTFEWNVYDHDAPADLRERLAAHGFEILEDEAIMVLDVQALPAALRGEIPPTIRQITQPEQINDILRVQRTVWDEDFDWLADELAESLTQRPEHLTVYAAYVDNAPVSSAWIRYTPNSQFASLWGGSTLEAHRGKGHYTALLAARAQEAARRGVRFLTVDASEMSRPILEKQGFQVISWAREAFWDTHKK